MDIQKGRSNSNFDLEKIALVSSSFQVPAIDFNPDRDLALSINVASTNLHNTDHFEVKLSLSIKLPKNDQTIATVVYSGKFQQIQENEQLTKEYFSQVNAPAIIYPYIRHHVRYLSLEAGFHRPIILPIINFVELARKR
jgi:preprotein translocase subunit SecB